MHIYCIKTLTLDKICPRCGNPVRKGKNFCAHCVML
ncbi:MAG: zinc ribbon domain-containing protein [Lachnospiraceae bacterium]